MEDDIDIEEHDILDHPQVKAIFPDLSKVQIEDLVTGAVLTSGEQISNGNLLVERLGYKEEPVCIDSQGYLGSEDCADDYQQYEDENVENQQCAEDNQQDADHCQGITEETVDSAADGQGFAEEGQDNIEYSQGVTGETLDNAIVCQDVEENGQGLTEETEEENLHNAESQQHTEQEIDIRLYGDTYSDDDGKNIPDVINICEESSDVDLGKENLDPVNSPEPECPRFLDCKLKDGDFDVADEIITPDNIHSSQNLQMKCETICDSDIETCRSDMNIENVEIVGQVNSGYDESEMVFDEPIYEEGSIESLLKTNKEDNVELLGRLTDGESRNEELSNFNEAMPTVTPNLSEYYKIPIKREYDENYAEFDENLPDESFNNEELPPEDIYHFQNKIILGSKPSPDLSLCHKIPIVLLENWGKKLDESDTYCVDCQTLFSTPNTLNAHKMIAHSLLTPLPNRAIKSTAKCAATKSSNTARKRTCVRSDSTFCNHCNVNFENHVALITHLYEVLPSKQFACTLCDAKFQNQNDLITHKVAHIKIERKILKPKTNPLLRKLLAASPPPIIKTEIKTRESHKFKCMLCHKILPTYKLTRSHREKEHPEMAHKLIFKRIINNKKPKAKTKDKPKVKIANDNFDIIPSALFKCVKCNLHFMTCISAVSHISSKSACYIKSYQNQYKRTLCQICNKTILKIDKKTHEKQHEISAKFKVYNITKTMYTRSLCKCLKCKLHFVYPFFKGHIKSCGKITAAKCDKCNILFEKKRLDKHMLKHNTLKLKPKDFIIVDYAVTYRNENAKAEKPRYKPLPLPSNNITIPIKVVKEKTETQQKVKMYYCRFCKNYLDRNNNRTTQSHLSNMCKKYGSICKFCGLRVPARILSTHQKIHENQKITLFDYAFYHLKTLKPMTPQAPRYKKCTKCLIHFYDKLHLRSHVCWEDYENCDTCGDKYEVTSLALHQPFHTLEKPAQNIPDKIAPELIMMYESLNAIWNIVFECGKCELVTDIYNKAIEHSQGHLNKESNVKTIKCYLCSMKFEESCWAKHSDLHARMNIKRQDFKILTYAPENLLDESWFQMFDTLPEKEIRQIIDQSVFGSERGVKMKLAKDGLPEFTIHCCSECKVAFDNTDIIAHMKAPCNTSPHTCIKCNIAFDKQDTLQFHEQLHSKKIKPEEFRIVHFIKNFEIKSKTRRSIKVKTDSKTVKPYINEKAGNVNHKTQFVLYKCRECSACIHLESKSRIHKCDKTLVKCNICKQNFTAKRYHMHSNKHKANSKFIAENITIIDFQPMTSMKKVKIQLKTPTVNSSAKKDIQKRTTLNNSYIQKDTKKRTTLNSSKIIKETHKRKTLNSSKTDKDVVNTAKVYKCDCGLHFTTLKTIEEHVESCTGADIISKENCSKCGLLFPTNILVSHLCKHHSQDTEIQVQEVKKDSNKPKIKLYKCGPCNVYYMNQNTCYKHTMRHIALDPKDYIECKICSFQFTIWSLQNHMKKHHQGSFNLDKVLVEEYRPVEGKAPLFDLYFASQRLDSQVSSSND